MAFAARVAVFGLIAVDQSPVSIAVFALVFGATFMVTAPMTVLFVRDQFGMKHLGALTGLITMVHQIFGGIGAWGGAVMFDATGTYDVAFVLMLALSALALALTLLLMLREKAPAWAYLSCSALILALASGWPSSAARRYQCCARSLLPTMPNTPSAQPAGVVGGAERQRGLGAARGGRLLVESARGRHVAAAEQPVAVLHHVLDRGVAESGGLRCRRRRHRQPQLALRHDGTIGAAQLDSHFDGRWRPFRHDDLDLLQRPRRQEPRVGPHAGGAGSGRLAGRPDMMRM